MVKLNKLTIFTFLVITALCMSNNFSLLGRDINRNIMSISLMMFYDNNLNEQLIVK